MTTNWDALIQNLEPEQRAKLLRVLETTPVTIRVKSPTPSPLSNRDKWRRSYKELCDFVELVNPELNLWWDGWVADFEFESATQLMKMTLIRFDQERRSMLFRLEPIRAEESAS